MKSINQAIRLWKINVILAKYGLDQFFVSLPLFSSFRFIVYLNPWNWFRKKSLTHGEALRKTLEELGPVFIKFGQALSTRPDILSPDIAFELSKLQDRVPPFESSLAIGILETSFKRSVQEIFASFDPQPLASASMAQVHAATLHSGEDVVVKILRPNIHKLIQQDVSILKTIAGLLDRYWPGSRRLKPKEIVREFEMSLLDELDLQREAANGSQLRRNFLHSPLLYIPEIHWDYVCQNVMVVERIYGIPVTDVARLKEHGVNFKKLAERGLEIFFLQVFRDCFFHADMHPGNIFVSCFHPDDPQYLCVDYGIIGTLGDRDKRYIAENLMAFFNRDYRRVAQLHVESGWVARDTPVEMFESAIRTVCEPIFERPLKDISFALLVLRLLQVARRFNMEVQPQLVLLQKTLLAVEGLGRQLYPELDLWVTAKPILEKWLREQNGPRAFLTQIKNNAPYWIEQLPNMPSLVNEILLLTKERKLVEMEQNLNEFKKIKPRQSFFKGIGLGLIVGGLSLGGIGYLESFKQDTMMLMSISEASLGVLIAVLNRGNS